MSAQTLPAPAAPQIRPPRFTRRVARTMARLEAIERLIAEGADEGEAVRQVLLSPELGQEAYRACPARLAGKKAALLLGRMRVAVAPEQVEAARAMVSARLAETGPKAVETIAQLAGRDFTGFDAPVVSKSGELVTGADGKPVMRTDSAAADVSRRAAVDVIDALGVGSRAVAAGGRGGGMAVQVNVGGTAEHAEAARRSEERFGVKLRGLVSAVESLAALVRPEDAAAVLERLESETGLRVRGVRRAEAEVVG